jgi:peptidoglycan hydrolase-like protein with peptidoglycan-binding domain
MSYIKKVITGFAALALLVSLAPVGVGAQTTADLQAQIAALLAQVNALTAQLNAGAAVTATFTRDLTLGSTGADVQALQRWLNANGYLVASVGPGAPGQETMYFGGLTKAAVARFQAANNISPAVGYFGPITRSAVNAMIQANVGTGSGTGTGTTTPPPADDDDELEGGAGSISDADFVSNLNNEEVGEGEEDAEVAGLEIEADDGSDIMITAVRLVFVKTSAGAGSSDDFEDYADEVSLWFNGEEVARVDGDEFDDDNDFSRTISLDENAIIRMSDMGDLVVAVSGIGNLDSDDEDETWTVEFDTIRFRDAQGAIISDTATGDIGATREFSFESFASASGSELQITSGDDAINDARMINVHATDDTDDVEIMSFGAEVEGDSDLNVDEIVVEFTVTGAGFLDEMLSSVYLLMDGEEVGNENVPTDENTVTFDDLDLDLDAGGDYEFTVVGDFLSIAGALDEGDTILAVVTDTETDLWDVEDESGEDLADADKTGAESGEAHVVFDVTFDVSSIDWETTNVAQSDTSGIDESVTYELAFDVTAVDGDVYIDDGCTEDSDGTLSAAGTGMNYSAANDADFTFSCLVSSEEPDAGDNFVVDEGDTVGFTYTITVTATTASDTARLTLEAINWSEADEVGDRLFTGSLNENQSQGVFINNRP